MAPVETSQPSSSIQVIPSETPGIVDQRQAVCACPARIFGPQNHEYNKRIIV